jgi:hypothetical protein
VATYSEYGNEYATSIKDEKPLDRLSDYQFLQDSSAWT